ncbi:hypothetical protein A8C56_18060 [Niabella ginsenosidivorans]|uniref:DUF2975 domain-containing protein n=1 Tax=Niabella ginsenosidivorans TaxID=1176587 RepID=A0A1A9I7W7_9BACT|nr:DUF2975 domain-containing protein [Niabella ginsenosidivorans]ANH82624.1 hypothetical protein A8C56_18060 [Niabella ginsenosidivorans]
MVVAYISIGIAFFVKLYQLIASIGQNKIFEMTNIKRVTSLGWLAILIGIITYQLNYLFFYIKNAPGLQHEGEIYKAELPCWPFLLGLVLLTVGYTFKKGLELKEENDMTI